MFSLEYHVLYIVQICLVSNTMNFPLYIYICLVSNTMYCAYMFSFEYLVHCNNAHCTYMFIYVCTVCAHLDIFIKRADFDFPLFLSTCRSLINTFLLILTFLKVPLGSFIDILVIVN